MSQKDKRSAKRYANHGRRKWSEWSNQQRKSRRELGQNFLKDKWVARQMVAQSGVGKDDFVVEFGAGGGILTGQLAKKAREVMAVEYDPRWVSHLKARFSQYENVRVVHEDALRVELPSHPFRVVASVPFYITTSILHRLLDDPTTPPEVVHLLVQKQVALKHARPTPTTLKTLNWSPWYRFSAGLELPAKSFHPKPEVDACMMVVARRDPPLVDPRHRHLFRALVHLAFEGHGNVVGKVLRLIFTKTQLQQARKRQRVLFRIPLFHAHGQAVGERFRVHGSDGPARALAFFQTTRQERKTAAMLTRASFRSVEHRGKGAHWRSADLHGAKRSYPTLARPNGYHPKACL